MTRRIDPTAMAAIVELVMDNGPEAIADGFAGLLQIAMELQRDEALAAGPHERTDDRRGYRNGYKDKKLQTRVGVLDLKVPKARGVEFYPDCLEKGLRSERAFSIALAEMYVQGVSTRKVTRIVEELCGGSVSSATVSRAAAQLDETFEAWRTRPLDEVTYLVLDARYEKVREGGKVISAAILTAVGVLPDGTRRVLGVSCELSEAEVHWRSFLRSLFARGMHGVRMVVSDDHKGLRAALRSCFPNVLWQRCQVHLQRNAMAYVTSKAARAEVAAELRTIFNAADLEEATRRLGLMADRYRESMPRLAAWLEEAVPEGFGVFALPPSHRRRLRTTNLLECINKELKRRTRVAGLFPNPASVLRLVTALLIERDEEWAGGRRYITMEPVDPSKQ